MPKKYDTFVSRSEICKTNTMLLQADASKSELCKQKYRDIRSSVHHYNIVFISVTNKFENTLKMTCFYKLHSKSEEFYIKSLPILAENI